VELLSIQGVQLVLALVYTPAYPACSCFLQHLPACPN